MAVETDVSELRKRQKEKNKRNFMIRFFVVLTVAVLVMIAVLTKNSWYPYLDGILTKIPSRTSMSDSENAELAEGQFPITVTGGSDFQTAAMDNFIAIIDDSHFMVYDVNGKQITEKQHTYSNPILTVSDKKALIYDLGGNNFSLESKYKTIYEKTTDQTILMAELSSSDYAAVVTKSDKFLAQLDIYGPDGNSVFTYKSYDSRIIDVTFTSDGGCIVTTLTASGGQVWSGLIKFSFSSTDMIWETEKIPTLAVSANIDDSGNIVMIGNDRIVFFDGNGLKLSEQEYGDDIVDYAYSGRISAVLLENTALRRYHLMIIDGSDVNNYAEAELPEAAEHILVSDKMIYVLTGSGIYTYNNLGQEISGTRLTDSYADFCRLGNYMFLIGYDEINRIDFSG